MSNVVVLLCACAVLASGASAQLCGGLVQSSCGLQSTGLGLLNGGIGSYGLSSYGVGSGLLGGVELGCGVDALSVATGSSYAPNGISVLADNLEIAGPVAVSGAYPILGTVSFGGNLPTGGQGEVSYSTNSGVGLTSGGCGYGLPSAQPTVPNCGLSVNNYGLSGVSGCNGLLGASQLGLSNSGCGCGNLYY